MTVDLSQLSPEKRKFLDSNPDLLKGLEEAIPKQVQQMNKRQEKLNKGKAKWQRDLDSIERRVSDTKEKAEELRRMYDPQLMEIEHSILDKTVVKDGLVCPNCGEPDRGNKNNGKSWCFKCNEFLVPIGKLEGWKKMSKIRVLPKDWRDELKQLEGIYK